MKDTEEGTISCKTNRYSEGTASRVSQLHHLASVQMEAIGMGGVFVITGQCSGQRARGAVRRRKLGFVDGVFDR
ncbi:hypothetical protein X798_07226 [Onchocerca flexuosa]|uniref:Uncharacterized protein n=1 Tax=Onchocerca flexuosa TaxID=387005 RepID=A0A238BMR4_9BILA|nr:hypothetical protein X798_07226 [Onchocerca flexuosa]